MPAGQALPLLELAAALGAWADREHTLFELTGRWAADATHPRATRVLATLSAHHGERLEHVLTRLPSIGGEGPARWLLGPATDIAGADGESAQLRLLAESLLPALLTDLVELGAPIDDRIDGPTHRLIARCCRDLTEDLDMVRQALTTMDAAPERR